MQLRSMLAEMGMSSIPSILSVPNVSDAFKENGVPNDRAYHNRANKFLDEFEWYIEALKKARFAGTPQ